MKKFYVKKEKKIKNNNLILTNLLKSKSHLGYSKKKTHPNSFDYLIGVRQNQSIINLDITVQSLLRVFRLLNMLICKSKRREPKNIIIIANDLKTQHFKKRIFSKKALYAFRKNRVFFHFINKKWVGGALTNPKLNKYFKKTNLILAFNTIDDHLLIKESIACGKPFASVINTNTDPSLIQYPILINDNNVKSTFFITEIFVKYFEHLADKIINAKLKKKI